MFSKSRISSAKLALTFVTICGLAVLCAAAAPSANASTDRSYGYPGSALVSHVARCSDGMYTTGLQRYIQTPTYEVGISPQYSSIAQVVTMQATAYYKLSSDNYSSWKQYAFPTQSVLIAGAYNNQLGGATAYTYPGEFDTLVVTLTWKKQDGTPLGSRVFYLYDASDYTIEPSRTWIESAYIGSTHGCWFHT